MLSVNEVVSKLRNIPTQTKDSGNSPKDTLSTSPMINKVFYKIFDDNLADFAIPAYIAFHLLLTVSSIVLTCVLTMSPRYFFVDNSDLVQYKVSTS